MYEAYRDALLNVDSYGAIFMYATHKDLTTAPRHIVRMTEPVDPRVLLAAVRTALDRYPQFGLGLVRGEKQYRYRIQRLPVPLRVQAQHHLSGIPALYLGRTRLRPVHPHHPVLLSARHGA